MLQDIKQFLLVLRCKMIRKKGAFDFESHLITNETPCPKPVCCSFYTDDGEEGIVVGMKDMEDKLREILEWDLILAHNAKFEATIIHKYFPRLREALYRAYEQGRLKCTMIAEQYILNCTQEKTYENVQGKKVQRGVSLAALVDFYLGIDVTGDKKNPDAWRLRYNELEGVPLEKWPKEAIDYSIQDSVLTYKSYLHQVSRWDVVAETSFRADFMLAIISHKGYLVDKERVLLTEKELLKQIEEPRRILKEAGFGYIQQKGKNKGKYSIYEKKFREYIEKNITNPRYSAKKDKKTGEWIKTLKTSASILVEYVPKLDIIDTYLEFKKISTILNNFIKAMKTADPVIRTDYSTTAVTGRTTSKQTKMYPSTNLQNLPRGVDGVTYDIRNSIVPREGFELLSIDYGGLEIAACGNQLKKFFGYSKLNDMLNSGEEPVDPHCKYAAEVMTVEKGIPISYEHFKKHKGEPEFKIMRKICKRNNLSIPGGGGYSTLRGMMYADGIKLPSLVQIEVPELTTKTNGKIVSAKQARFLYGLLKPHIKNLRIGRISPFEWVLYDDIIVEMKRNTFRMYPMLEQFLKKHHKKFLNGRTAMIPNKFGIKEETNLYDIDLGYIKRVDCTYTELCNSALMQSPSAEGAKRMIYNIEKHFFEDPDVNIVGFVHDELIVEIKDRNKIDKIAEIMIKSMQEILIHTRVNVEAQVMDMWSKKKEDVKWEALYWGDPNKEIKKKVSVI